MNEPPNNQEAEMALLGSMMGDIELWHALPDDINADDFYHPQHKFIFETLHGCEIHDFVIFREYLVNNGLLEKAGGMGYLAMVLESVPTSANIGYYAAIVKKASLRRKIIAAAQRVSAEAMSLDNDPVKVLATHQAKLDTIMSAAETFSPTPAEKVFQNADAEFQRIEKAAASGHALHEVTFGIAKLDEYIACRPGYLIIIAGRPSMGKTSLAITIWNHNTQAGVPGLFMSLEMAEDSIACNTMIAAAGVDNEKAQEGRMEFQEHEKIRRVLRKTDKFAGYLYAPHEISLEKLQNHIRIAKRKYGIKYVVIDYLQLMDAPGRDSYHQVTNISKGLKKSCKEVDIPIFAVAQLSRKPEERKDPRPIVADLRGSGQIDQDADAIIMLWRDPEKSTIELLIRKYRYGRTGRAYAYCDMSKYLIANLKEGS